MTSEFDRNSKVVFEIIPAEVGWGVFKGFDVLATASTKDAAIEKAKELVMDHSGTVCELRVHREDGTIETEISWFVPPK